MSSLQHAPHVPHASCPAFHTKQADLSGWLFLLLLFFPLPSHTESVSKKYIRQAAKQTAPMASVWAVIFHIDRIQTAACPQVGRISAAIHSKAGSAASLPGSVGHLSEQPYDKNSSHLLYCAPFIVTFRYYKMHIFLMKENIYIS